MTQQQRFESVPDLTGKVMAGIPAYNTAKHIADVVERTLEVADHVVVVDDGSTDDTAVIARAAGATVVSHAQNRGYGGAIRTCFEYAEAANASVLVTVDGDGQHFPEDIACLLEPLTAGRAAVVIGSRFLETSQSSGLARVPEYRSFGIRVITFLFNVASGCRVTDAQCGLRAYNHKAIRRLMPDKPGMDVSVELIVNARARGLRMAEVPVSVLYHDGSSTQPPITHGIQVALAVLKFRSQAVVTRWLARLLQHRSTRRESGA